MTLEMKTGERRKSDYNTFNHTHKMTDFMLLLMNLRQNQQGGRQPVGMCVLLIFTKQHTGCGGFGGWLYPGKILFHVTVNIAAFFDS